MSTLWEAVRGALGLVLAGDSTLVGIVLLSLEVSLSAVVCATLLGLPLGAAIAVGRFPGRRAAVVLLNALMGLPPVVVGLFVYLMLSRAGAARRAGHPVHPRGHGARPDDPGAADHRCALPAGRRGRMD
jgi:ABC-type tungstate transport system substrate-binding protein